MLCVCVCVGAAGEQDMHTEGLQWPNVMSKKSLAAQSGTFFQTLPNLSFEKLLFYFSYVDIVGLRLHQDLNPIWKISTDTDKLKSCTDNFKHCSHRLDVSKHCIFCKAKRIRFGESSRDERGRKACFLSEQHPLEQHRTFNPAPHSHCCSS